MRRGSLSYAIAPLIALLLATGCGERLTATPTAQPPATSRPPTVTPALAASPMPGAGSVPTLPAASLAIEPVANPFQHRRLPAGESLVEPGDPISRQGGLFFMQVSTGAVEAWTLPGQERAASYQTSPDNRWVIAYTAADSYAADRESPTCYRWQPTGPRLLAAQGDHLVFRAEGQVWLAGPGHPTPVALPLPPGEAQAVISADGQRAAVLSGRTLYLVELADAACRAIHEVTDPAGGTIQSLWLRTARHGEAIHLSTYWQESSGREAHTAERIARYSWQGERLGELALPIAGLYAFSPDGRWLAWEERLSHLTQAVVVADAATLAPRLRIVGASLCWHDFGSGDWLADSSALLVRTNAGYGLVTLDGALAPAPTLKGPAGEPMPYPDEPLPALDRSDLFAVGRRAVVDATGKALAVAALDAYAGLGRPADLYPWGLGSREMRIALPHLGHGGKCGDTEYLLPARVERPPFGPLVLAVGLPADDCVNLRAAPGTSARVLTCLPGGTRLSPAPLAESLPSEGGVSFLTPAMAWTENSRWLRVRAPDGQEGWVDAQAGAIGSVP